MRYSAPDVEKAWRASRRAPIDHPGGPYAFDLTDITRQVIVNRARVLLPMLRRAYDNVRAGELGTLVNRWFQLMGLADAVEDTTAAFMLGAHLDSARAAASTSAEAAQLVRNAVNLITNWAPRRRASTATCATTRIATGIA
jgi:alpha-N-acetylglucosaminidase